MNPAIAVPRSALKYILLQRTQHIALQRGRVFKLLERVAPRRAYSLAVGCEALMRARSIRRLFNADMKAEYESIQMHLPARCARSLDIGCGVAGIDVCIDRHYRGAAELSLLDKTSIEPAVYYGFKPKGAFYNSLLIAQSLLVQNGIPSTRIKLLEATDDSRIDAPGPFDLVVSLISWGYHYPVSTYLTPVRERLARDGVLILDVRDGTDGLDILHRNFRGVEVIHDSRKDHFVRVRCEG